MNFLANEKYQAFIKPDWAPPSWVFGPVWTILYGMIVVTFGAVFWKAYQGQIPWFVAMPFLLNLLGNALFTPLQFGLQSNVLASLDIVLVLITLLWALYGLYAFGLTTHIETGASPYTWIIVANLPYLFWVIFATALQLTITYLNWK